MPADGSDLRAAAVERHDGESRPGVPRADVARAGLFRARDRTTIARVRSWHFAVGGVLCWGAAGVVHWLHIHEANSPLSFGLWFLGLSGIATPIILGAAFNRESAVRPGGKAVLQVVVFMLLGGVLTLWGLLGLVGLVRPVSWNGLRQHCLGCGTSSGRRDSEPHYPEVCSRCASVNLGTEVQGLIEDLCAKLGNDSSNPITVRSHVRLDDRTAAPLYPLNLTVHSAFVTRSTQQRGHVTWGHEWEKLELRVGAEGGVAPGAKEAPLKLWLGLFDTTTGRPVHIVERQRSFPVERTALGPTPQSGR